MKQELREREAEWKVSSEALKRDAEEQLSLRLCDLRQQAEADKQSMMDRFTLRETEMRQLQEQQAAQIRDLEGSLMEQQGRLRQLELGLPGDESPQCSQCGREPGGSPALPDRDRELTALRLQEDCALQLMLAQNRWVSLHAVSARCPREIWLRRPSRGGGQVPWEGVLRALSGVLSLGRLVFTCDETGTRRSGRRRAGSGSVQVLVASACV